MQFTCSDNFFFFFHDGNDCDGDDHDDDDGDDDDDGNNLVMLSYFCSKIYQNPIFPTVAAVQDNGVALLR